MRSFQAESSCLAQSQANHSYSTTRSGRIWWTSSPSGSHAPPSRRRNLPDSWMTEAAPEQANLDWSAGGAVDVGALAGGDSPCGCRQMIGNVWEWTATNFHPYPGFVIDPYKEYSEPWFYDHKVLRGGCWTTRSRLI